MPLVFKIAPWYAVLVSYHRYHANTHKTAPLSEKLNLTSFIIIAYDTDAVNSKIYQDLHFDHSCLFDAKKTAPIIWEQSDRR